MDTDVVTLFPYLAGVLGLLLGRLYIVCVHRYLAGAARFSLTFPSSACLHCLARLPWYNSLFLPGYILQRGRCRACGRPLGITYPAIEAVACFWAVLLAVEFGPSAQWMALMALGGILIVASAIDVELYLLPDILTFSGAVMAAMASILVLGLSPKDVVLGSLVGAGLFWLLQRAYRICCGTEGVGTGDVKLMLMLGAMCGLHGLPVLITVAAVCAVLVHLLWQLMGRRYALQGIIPFGPFLSLGGMAEVLWGEAITRLLS